MLLHVNTTFIHSVTVSLFHERKLKLRLGLGYNVRSTTVDTKYQKLGERFCALGMIENDCSA